jgi:DNA-binding GntR family transcriptional regulator
MPVPVTTTAIARPSLNQEVLARLRTWIVGRVLQPGEPIRDQELAQRLGVSRTPVREALLRLEAEGLVETSRNRWTRVSPVSVQTAEEIYPIIEALELLALRLPNNVLVSERVAAMCRANRDLVQAIDKRDAHAAAAADFDFHQAIITGCGNGELIGTVEGLRRKHQRLESEYFSWAPAASASVKEHDRIVAAIEIGRVETAARALSANWRNSLRRFRQMIRTRERTGAKAMDFALGGEHRVRGRTTGNAR